MKQRSTLLLCLLASGIVHAETPVTPATIPAARPVTAAPPKPAAAVTPPATAVTTPAPVPVKPVAAPARIASPPAATAVAPVAEVPAAPVLTLEQRRQLELVSNAQRIDKANHELLAKNQELQLQNENLNLQNNVLKRDKSSDGIWKGALAVIAGFLMGWYFSGGGRRKSSW